METNIRIMKLSRGHMVTKHKGSTIVELIIVLGIMALISMIIATMLSSTIMLNKKISSANDKEYKSHEFFRFLRTNIKSFKVSNIVIEEEKISIFYSETHDGSNKIEFIENNYNVKLVYYEEYGDSYRSTNTRIILKDINNINFKIDKNLLYVNVYWKDGGSSSGIIDL